jgi:hypothetical protein
MEYGQLLAAAFAGGSGLAAVIYVVRVLVKAGRDPTRLGAWLPRLLAGWHIGMADAENARLKHVEAKQKRTMQKPVDAASGRRLAGAAAPKELPATVENAIGAEKPTGEKVVASQSDHQGPIEPITAAEVPGESARRLPHHSGTRSRARQRERTSSPR